MVWLPEVALAPVQAPVAEQLAALLDDHVSCADPPCATVPGAALSETAGAAVGAGVGLGVGVDGDPATGPPPPLPPPQATRFNAQINASAAPRPAVGLDCS